jgi:hypothetical protein
MHLLHVGVFLSMNCRSSQSWSFHYFMDCSCLFKYLVEDYLQELSSECDSFSPSDVERALWSSAIGAKLLASHSDPDSKRKRKR